MLDVLHRSFPVTDDANRPLQNLQLFSEDVSRLGDIVGVKTLNGMRIVRTLSDLPRPVGDVITIPSGVGLLIADDLDLKGYRLVCESPACIKGVNAEVSSIYSSLSSGAMIYSEGILQLRDITLSTGSGAYCVEVDGSSNPSAVADWFAVNFTGGKAAKLTTLGNVIMILMGILNPDDGIEFYGTFGTVAITESIFSVSGAKTSLKFGASAVISRRIRIGNCAFVAGSGCTSISVPLTATVPDDAYAIFFCNFSGAGTYIDGYQYDSLKARFSENRGINNTYRAASLYVEGNATATTIAIAGTYYKVAGTTSLTSLSRGFTHSSNRLTCESIISKLYSVNFSVNFAGTTANEYAFKVYKNGSALLGGKFSSTANAAGKAENVGGDYFVELGLNDYLEIYVTNLTAANNITAVDFSLDVVEK